LVGRQKVPAPFVLQYCGGYPPRRLHPRAGSGAASRPGSFAGYTAKRSRWAGFP
jgi:hypothetical protein